MGISLGGYFFAPGTVQAKETHEEIGGRDARVIELRGMVHASEGREALFAAMDEILAAASDGGAEIALSLRDDRVLHVRRMQFVRDEIADTLTASYRIRLEAEDPFEYSAEEHVTAWDISASGAAVFFAPEGNVDALPVIELLAEGDVIHPAITDNTHSLLYPGMVLDGQLLVMDCALQRVLVDGLDVTHHCTGAFPRLAPESAVLTYTDDAASSHHASGDVRWRDRWW